MPAVKPDTATAGAPASLPGLQGTEVDGELKADSAGNLQLNLALRDYLDYFLSAADQAGLETVVEAMLADARGRLPEPALGQFIGLLGDYMDYKRASLALLQQPLSAAQQSTPDGQLVALQRAFEQLAQLRRTHFSSAATEALFGAEEAYGRYTLDNLALMAREDLSEHAKALAQERLRAQLPEAMRTSEERQAQAQALQVQTDKLWQEGASEEQVRQLLALTYDPPTVERLLSEQRNERAWQQRYATYQQELAALQGNGLSAADQQQEQQRLRQRLFSAEDQHRVETYDAIAAKQQDSQSPEL
ncbi:lipase secretion chaperone [Pseudomonas peli]|uniref:lipase secretion chaperone n=1 Tax=Pseudomonas peli TaxID=592361 RepID=UPI003D3214EA